jgi:hypothetical protein
VVVRVLSIQHLFEEASGAQPEVLDDCVVLLGAKEMLELGEDAPVLPGVKLPLFLRLQQL